MSVYFSLTPQILSSFFFLTFSNDHCLCRVFEQNYYLSFLVWFSLVLFFFLLLPFYRPLIYFTMQKTELKGKIITHNKKICEIEKR